MPGEKREVAVKLSLEMGPANERAMKDLERQLANVGRANEKMMQSAAAAFNPVITNPLGGRPNVGGIPGSGGTKGTGATAAPGGMYGEMLSGLGGVGGAVGRFAAPIATVGVAAAAVRSAAALHHDPYISTGQSQRAFIRGLPGGAFAQDFLGDITGHTARMNQINVNAQMQGVDLATAGRVAGFGAGFNPQQAGLAGLAAGYAGASALTLPYINRSTASGEQEYREQSRLLVVKRDQQKAEIELRSATAARVSSEREYVKASERSATLTGQRADAEQKYAEIQKWYIVPNRERDQRLLKQSINAGEAADEAYQQKQNAAMARMSAQQREAAARGAVGMTQAREFGVMADIAGSRAEAASGRAISLATMTPGDLAQGRMYYQMLQSGYSPQAIGQHGISSAMAFAPDETRKILETVGAGMGAFGESQAGKFGSPEELRRKEAEYRAQEGKGEFASESATAQAVAAAGRDVGGIVVSAIRQMGEEIKGRIMAELKLGKNNP